MLFMPLTVASIGKQFKVVKNLAQPKAKKHLENLGLLAGSVVTVIADNAGDLIVKIKDSRVAINRDLALKIFVE